MWLSLLKLAWKPVGIIAIVLLFGLWCYNKGKAVERNKIAVATATETLERIEDYNKEKTKLTKEREKILEKRKTSPERDKLDSCLLSNSPFSGACDKL